MPTRFLGSRAHSSDLCVPQIPNRTFATPYVSTPFLSHARSYSPTANVTLFDIADCAPSLDIFPKN